MVVSRSDKAGTHCGAARCRRSCWETTLRVGHCASKRSRHPVARTGPEAVFPRAHRVRCPRAMPRWPEDGTARPQDDCVDGSAKAGMPRCRSARRPVLRRGPGAVASLPRASPPKPTSEAAPQSQGPAGPGRAGCPGRVKQASGFSSVRAWARDASASAAAAWAPLPRHAGPGAMAGGRDFGGG